MIAASEDRAVHSTAPGTRRTRVEIRPLDSRDAGFVRTTWRETHHQAPGKRRIPWAAYKATFGAQIDRLLDRDDVWILGAYDDSEKLCGWIAWSPGGRVATVHYVWVRRENQREGMALRLLKEAELGVSFVFTHRGLRPRGQVDSLDVVLVAALAKRHITAAYVPAAKFLG